MNIEQFLSPDKIYITVAVLATLALLLVSILVGVTIRRRQRYVLETCRYRPRRRLMDSTESHCFKLLIDLFGKYYYIIPSVELSSLLNHKVGTQDRSAAYGFIEGKTVDFVLCNKRTIRPICAVKLNDGTPRNVPGNRITDWEQFFRTAHIPFVYLSKNKNITRNYLINEFSRIIYELSLSEH